MFPFTDPLIAVIYTLDFIILVVLRRPWLARVSPPGGKPRGLHGEMEELKPDA